MMNKLFVVSAFVGLMLTGCTSESELSLERPDVQQEQELVPMTFSTYNKAFSKATADSDLDYLKTNKDPQSSKIKCKIFQYITEGQASSTKTIYEGVLYYDPTADVFKPTETVYWPQNPVNVVVASTPNDGYTFYGNPVVVWAPGYGAKDDFILAHAEKLIYDAKTNGQVSLQFSHIMGNLAISAKGEKANYVYVVKKVTCNSINGWDAYDFDQPYTQGHAPGFELSVYATPRENTDFVYYPQTEATPTPTISLEGGTTATMTALDDENTLYMIPGQDITVKVEYQVVVREEGKADVVVNDYTGNNAKTCTIQLEAGKRTRLNLTLPSGPVPIGFTTEIQSIGEETETTQTM